MCEESSVGYLFEVVVFYDFVDVFVSYLCDRYFVKDLQERFGVRKLNNDLFIVGEIDFYFVYVVDVIDFQVEVGQIFVLVDMFFEVFFVFRGEGEVVFYYFQLIVMFFDVGVDL